MSNQDIKYVDHRIVYNELYKALAAKEDGSSSESGIDIFSKPNPLLSFSYSKSLFLESSLIERYILGT